MYYKNYIKDKSSSEKSIKKQPEFIEKAIEFVQPIMDCLNSKIDQRLTYTVFDTFMGMLSFRDRINGLVLSELGAYVNGPKHAPAGTKRISNLLRDKNWTYKDIEQELLKKVKKRLSREGEEGKQWLMHWDDSVIEKAESWKVEGLCPVFSSKASRITRIKPGYYKKYGRICVPGFEWSAGVLSSLCDPPTIGIMKWWTTKGRNKDSRSNVLYRMLRQSSEIIKQTQAEVWHVFDRGYANKTTLDYLINHFEQQFIIRWKSNLLLINSKGESKKIARDKRKGRKPIYFLTDVPIDTNGMAWAILRSYMKRWDVEQVFRFGKTAMGMESPRLWFWENRLKLLMLVTLVIAFILTLFDTAKKFSWRLIKTWVPRTGNRQKKTFLPIYRLRLAISFLISYELNPT